jgi:fumarate hydratase subunit alpha
MGIVREIKANEITAAVEELFSSCARSLPQDVEDAIRAAREAESSPIAAAVLGALGDNLDAARRTGLPICQDTGMAIVFADVGQDVHIDGDFNEAVDLGVARAYKNGYLRCSVVSDPLYDRKNTTDNTPAVIHIRFVPGDRLTLTAAPKGFGSENMSAVKMFDPSATEDDIAAFVVSSVRDAGSKPCPPIIVGVGVGGDFESCALMAKRALLRPLSLPSPDARYAALEDRLKLEINALGIGPQGFGGDTTALAVKIEYAPTHIAGLPVAVSICCHVSRHAAVVL